MTTFNLKTVSSAIYAGLNTWTNNKQVIKKATGDRDMGLLDGMSNLAWLGVNLDIKSKDADIRRDAKTKLAHVLSKIEDKFSTSSREVASSFIGKFNQTYRAALMADGEEHNTLEFVLEIFAEENLKSWDSFRNYQNVIVEEKLSKAADSVYNHLWITLDNSSFASDDEELAVLEDAFKKALLKVDKMKAKKIAELEQEAEAARKETKKQAKAKEIALVA